MQTIAPRPRRAGSRQRGDHHGWNTASAPVFIQSFETNLRELRPKTKIKLNAPLAREQLARPRQALRVTSSRC